MQGIFRRSNRIGIIIRLFLILVIFISWGRFLGIGSFTCGNYRELKHKQWIITGIEVMVLIYQSISNDSLIIQYPDKQTDIDIVFDILYDTLNSTKPTIRIGGEGKPTMVVIGKLMKLQPDDLVYSIDKYHEQTERIKNVKAYLLTVLYGSREQQHLDIMNLGHHNGDF